MAGAEPLGLGKLLPELEPFLRELNGSYLENFKRVRDDVEWFICKNDYRYQHHIGAIEMSQTTLQYDICPQLKPILDDMSVPQ